MDASIDRFLTDSTHIWRQIMDKLNELKEWQRMQEEVIRRRQSQQIESLNEQNTKLNALANNQLGSDDNKAIHVIQSNANPLQPTPALDQQMDRHCDPFSDNESIEEIRAEDNCHQTSGNNESFVSYLETSPVVPGIDGKNVKTFEELLDLRLNSDKFDDSVKNAEKKPKKPFLRKGEGIKRFNGQKWQTIETTERKRSVDQKVCLKANETKSFINKTKQKMLEKEWINRRKDKKNEEICVKPKTFNRKVIPLTTKSDKKTNKSVIISRNTPTVIRSEDESDFLDYLQRICENMSIEDNSVDEIIKDKDINELQDLLQKIEIKKKRIYRQLGPNERTVQTVANTKERKKKVRWSPNTCTQITTEISDESDEQSSDLIEPKSGAYSLAIKQQMSELEDRLSRLKSVNKDRVVDNCINKTSDPSNVSNDELIRLREQIERLNKRILNIEANSYDLISPQMKAISRKSNVKCNVDKTVWKTITSPSNGLNVSVNESLSDTTIDFPNGDKMTVSKDNTIFYVFASGATQTTYPDGLKIVNFPNGQTEKMHKNGVKHITYANGLQRIINPDSSEETVMTDGTVWRIHSDGSEVLEFPNGDREIRTDKYKRREYRNGNIKTVYSDGTEETRYSSGRLRIKDMFGNLMVDSLVRHLNEHI